MLVLIKMGIITYLLLLEALNLFIYLFLNWALLKKKIYYIFFALLKIFLGLIKCFFEALLFGALGKGLSRLPMEPALGGRASSALPLSLGGSLNGGVVCSATLSNGDGSQTCFRIS
jgi:hypothetical protein